MKDTFENVEQCVKNMKLKRQQAELEHFRKTFVTESDILNLFEKIQNLAHSLRDFDQCNVAMTRPQFEYLEKVMKDSRVLSRLFGK